MIPTLVAEWEKGYKVICAVKKTSRENKLMRFLRTCYYKMIRKMSSVEQIEHFTGFGLYDRSFVEELAEYSFEGEIFKGPKNYDRYLTTLYGDYMELPPEGERENRHQIIEIDFGEAK